VRITDWPVDERPREKLLARGAETLSDAELLALFIDDPHLRCPDHFVDPGRVGFWLGDSTLLLCSHFALGPTTSRPIKKAVVEAHNRVKAYFSHAGSRISNPTSAQDGWRVRSVGFFLVGE